MPDRQTSSPSTRPSGKDARRDAAREKARQLREAEARKKRRNRVLAISAGVVALVLVVGAVAVGISRSGNDTPQATPPGVTADGGIVVGNADAPHTITVFQDYQCPVCKQYEGAIGPWLQEQAEAGTAKVEYRTLTFLDDRLRQDYSARAANAAYCVNAADTNDFFAFNTAMYLEQPEEGAGGLTDSKLVSIAQAAGADVGQCIAAQPYADYVQERNDAAFDLQGPDGQPLVTGTPTVLVDGARLQNDQGGPPTQEQLATAIGATA